MVAEIVRFAPDGHGVCKCGGRIGLIGYLLSGAIVCYAWMQAHRKQKEKK